MAIDLIQRNQSLIIYGFALVAMIICGCMYYKSLHKITIFLDDQNQCIIAHNGDQFVKCETLKSTSLEYVLNHYRVMRFTKDAYNNEAK